MKKAAFFLIILSLFSLGVSVVSADVPTVTSIGVTTSTDGRTLTITVRHSGPSSIHYVSKLEVKVGEDVKVVELEPQTTAIFTDEVNVASSGAVEARAFCTLHGWSAWASLGGDSPDTPNPSGGIPGFSLVSIGLGLTILAVLRKRGW
jgi:desulfoferrodoxin (superoxide reductase-like protein)